MSLFAKFNHVSDSGQAVKGQPGSHPDNRRDITTAVASWEEIFYQDQSVTLIHTATFPFSSKADFPSPAVVSGINQMILIPKAAFDHLAEQCMKCANILYCTLEGLKKIHRDYRNRQGMFQEFQPD